MSIFGLIADRSSAIAWTDTRTANFDGGEYGETLKLHIDARFPSAVASRGLAYLGLLAKFYLAAKPWSFGEQVERFPQLVQECAQQVPIEFEKAGTPIPADFGKFDIFLAGFDRKAGRVRTIAAQGDVHTQEFDHAEDFGFLFGPAIGEESLDQSQRNVERIARRQQEVAKDTPFPAGGSLIICRLSENGASIIRVNDFFN